MLRVLYVNSDIYLGGYGGEGVVTSIGLGTWFVRSILIVTLRRSHYTTLALPPP